MDNHDGMIKREDLKAIRRQMGKGGWGDAALALFEREPLLGECIANRWARVRIMMTGLGLTEDQQRPVMREVIKLIVESLELQQRAKNKLLADFLPGAGDDEADGGNKGGAHAE